MSSTSNRDQPDSLLVPVSFFGVDDSSRTDRVRTWTGVIFLFIFADAVSMQARGPILASLEGEFGVSDAALGPVAPAGTVGSLTAVVATGVLAEGYGIGRALWSTVLIVVALLVTVAVLWLWTGTADVPTAGPVAD